MDKTLYRVTRHCQEVEFESMDWDALIGDTFKYLRGLRGQGNIETDQEFVLKSEAEKYVKDHSIRIARLPYYFFVQWLELYEVVFNESGDEIDYTFVAANKLDSMSVHAEDPNGIRHLLHQF